MLNKKIDYFISVVESGSFSQAAKQHLLSQSAISQQVLLLEKELGIKLFDRNGYKPILTSAGRYFYSECKKLIQTYDTIMTNAKIIQNNKKKIINIGITGPLEEKHLPQILNQYKKVHPDIRINIKKITFGNGIKLLEEGKLDAAFGITNDFNGKKGISTVTLLEHKVCVICSNQHPWSKRDSVSGAEVSDQPIISFSPRIGDSFYYDFIKSFKDDGITPNIIKEVDELNELLLSVRINEGIALIAREVITNTDDLCVLDIENTHHHAVFCIGYLTESSNAYLQAFVTATSQYFFNLGYKKN